jgi:hypothetical protein
MDTRLDVRSVAAEIAACISAGSQEDHRLRWRGAGYVRVLTSDVVPTTNKQTTAGRRRRSELANTDATTVTPGAFSLMGGSLLSYTLLGDCLENSFSVTHVDGNADSDIAVACFAAGTRSRRARPSIRTGLRPASLAVAPVAVGDFRATDPLSRSEIRRPSLSLFVPLWRQP